jgi:integrase
VRVDLKGIHRVPKRLASGRVVEYHYAWRGGPRLVGAPGSDEYLRSLVAARESRKAPSADVFQSIVTGYRKSSAYTNLRPRTRQDYDQHIARIETEFGDMPLDALEDPRVTRDFTEWRDGLPGGLRQQDYGWMVLMRLLSWGRREGFTTYRPPERMERLYNADRAEKIWEEGHIAAFMAVAARPLQRALVLALETGQRQGDLIVLPWSGYARGDDGRWWVTLRQLKSKRHNREGRLVKIPATTTLQRMLASMPRTGTVVLTNAHGVPWKGNAFRKAWGAAAAKAGIKDRTFHDLRGTAVTRLSEAGCTPQEIASITGHSLRSVTAILEKYLARTDKLAIAAISKLERGGT